MPDSETSLTLSFHSSIAAIAAQDWDQCAGTDNPFVSSTFLNALEESGSATAHTGWQPHHVSLRDAGGSIVAVIPLYIKAHSYGEYVFDQPWADAFQRAGGNYYPKLQAAIPFSPVPGPRLLLAPDAKSDRKVLGDVLAQLCQQLDLSSAHVTFCTQDEYEELGQIGWLQRLGMQFHWHNQDYKNFEDFLAQLSSRHRKIVRRERREAQSLGLTFQALTGHEIKETHWDAFYRFYQNTIDRKWGSAYLTRTFFSLLSENLGDKVVLMLASDNGAPVAGALNIAGSDTLYGRNWGVSGDYPFLHFELCYYRAIDYAIEHGLKTVEAGAQGMHKIKRGYLPQPTYSAHWIAHPGLARAVKNFLEDERSAVQSDIEAMTALSPFRREAD